MTQNFSIGKSVFHETPKKSSWMRLQNGDNIIRILPPVLSLAKSGKYEYFWAFHAGFKSSNGRHLMFECLLKTKDKIISQTCPVCEYVDRLISKYVDLKSQNENNPAYKEQLKNFWKTYIFPIQRQKYYFFNALNAHNQVVLLLLSTPARKALVDLLSDTARKFGVDATGIDGAWINLKKINDEENVFKTTYRAELVLEKGNSGDFAIKKHYITPEFIQNTFSQSARDLKNLFYRLSDSTLRQLVDLDESERAQFVDKIMSAGESSTEKTVGYDTVRVPNTDAQLVSRYTFNGEGNIISDVPKMPQSEHTNNMMEPNEIMLKKITKNQNNQPVNVNSTVTNPSPPQTNTPNFSISPDEFKKLFDL